MHKPEQQSAARVQAARAGKQHAPAPEHNVEQQSPPLEHALPVLRQLTQRPEGEQIPEQQSAPAAHTDSSGRQLTQLPLKHWSEQHCAPDWHTAPLPRQATQRPPAHKPLQQVAPPRHSAPLASQRAHTPPLQRPEQHASLAVQAWPSAVQAVVQRPSVHWLLQQSVARVHAPPVSRHATQLRALLAFATQSPLQQSVAPSHCAPTLKQIAQRPLASHRSEQQEPAVDSVQTPPVAVQLAHVPPSHRPLQQSLAEVQPVAPIDRHAPHTPPAPQRPVQQLASLSQPAPPVAMQAEHTPPLQRPEQHCASPWHGLASARHEVPGAAHTRPPSALGRQLIEQQSEATVQARPVSRHAAAHRKPSPPSDNGVSVHTPEQHSWPKAHTRPASMQRIPPSLPGTKPPPSPLPAPPSSPPAMPPSLTPPVPPSASVGSGPPKQRLTPPTVTMQHESRPFDAQPVQRPLLRMGRCPH